MLTQPTPLPSNPFDPTSQQFLAYNKCVKLESRASTHRPLQISKPTGLVAARLLGQLLLLAEHGRETLTREIINANANADLVCLARHYIAYFVRVFHCAGGQPPAPSEHPLEPSFEDIRSNNTASLDSREVKQAVLRRDSYRCPVTGLYDLASVQSGLVQLPEGERSWFTESVHIIPQATNTFIDQCNKAYHSAGVWAVLSMFSSNPVELHKQLNGNGIHQLENIITLDYTLHKAFDTLSLWFKPVDDSPNKYKIYTTIGHSGVRKLKLPETVTFTTTDTQLPVPSPYYLELHALCCEVTHLSGAGEYVGLVDHDLKGMQVLASDGSSAELLSFALSSVLVY